MTDRDPYVYVTGLDGVDKYRYLCEAGHMTITSNRYYDVCTAEVGGKPCGADTDVRLIPYVPQAEEGE